MFGCDVLSSCNYLFVEHTWDINFMIHWTDQQANSKYTYKILKIGTIIDVHYLKTYIYDINMTAFVIRHTSVQIACTKLSFWDTQTQKCYELKVTYDSYWFQLWVFDSQTLKINKYMLFSTFLDCSSWRMISISRIIHMKLISRKFFHLTVVGCIVYFSIISILLHTSPETTLKINHEVSQH